MRTSKPSKGLLALFCLPAYIAAILLSAVLFTTSVFAQAGELEVARNVNLRSSPSTDNDPIELLQPPQKLELISNKKRRNYYHVRLESGDYHVRY